MQAEQNVLTTKTEVKKSKKITFFLKFRLIFPCKVKFNGVKICEMRDSNMLIMVILQMNQMKSSKLSFESCLKGLQYDTTQIRSYELSSK